MRDRKEIEAASIKVIDRLDKPEEITTGLIALQLEVALDNRELLKKLVEQGEAPKKNLKIERGEQGYGVMSLNKN